VTFNKGATVEDLIARRVNGLGVTPRDTIAILGSLEKQQERCRQNLKII